MNHVTREYLTKMLDLWVSLCVLCVINITSLCCPVFPVCHISTNCKRYNWPPPEFASQTTPVQIICCFYVL